MASGVARPVLGLAIVTCPNDTATRAMRPISPGMQRLARRRDLDVHFDCGRQFRPCLEQQAAIDQLTIPPRPHDKVDVGGFAGEYLVDVAFAVADHDNARCWSQNGGGGLGAFEPAFQISLSSSAASAAPYLVHAARPDPRARDAKNSLIGGVNRHNRMKEEAKALAIARRPQSWTVAIGARKLISVVSCAATIKRPRQACAVRREKSDTMASGVTPGRSQKPVRGRSLPLDRRSSCARQRSRCAPCRPKSERPAAQDECRRVIHDPSRPTTNARLNHTSTLMGITSVNAVARSGRRCHAEHDAHGMRRIRLGMRGGGAIL